MKYKLYDENDNVLESPIYRVLRHRGIENPKEYLSPNKNFILSAYDLDNIKCAIDKFIEHIEKRSKIAILVDSDPDGYCSAAIIYKYIKRTQGEDYPVEYILHTQTKAHGLKGKDFTINDDVDLLIIPDASTNDKKELKELLKRMDIIILDHHELEVKYTKKDLNNGEHSLIIVNNQMSKNYTNKDFCGAGIVYKFIKEVENELWTECADDFVDLVALANISDLMDIRSYETKYYIDLGLKNIKNKFLQAIIKAQDYSMGGKVNIHNVQFYITPVLNGCIRVGSLEEKELLFRAFIEQDEFFEYKKRATKNKPAETIQESIYDRAARLSKNAKSRQDNAKKKGIKAILEYLDDKYNEDDKVVVVDTTELLDKGLTGLVAMNIAEKYNKPCILLNKYFDKNKNVELYGGSARNVKHSPIDSFKDVVNSTSVLNGAGHSNAFGIVDLEVDNKKQAIDELNNLLKDVVYDATYKVDFILDSDEVDFGFISELAKFEDIIGTGIEDPMIAIEKFTLPRTMFTIQGENEDTIKFEYNNIEFIQFNCDESNDLYNFLQNAWNENDTVTFDMVGKVRWSDYKGLRKLQICIKGVNVNEISNATDDTEFEEDDVW